ncbi:RagB/SusD family nutrient uptake outer membrane protein [Longitalea arenae]|uniref:RagB/SusD family nutrient uptake outer membrane protein n=1 Tax=Longitalea arenae TaxID=2812558 RepID=UPI0019681154|nr:RagB/SusD family nutrient uptake outer membrane protein [Longitalea arenae]
MNNIKNKWLVPCCVAGLVLLTVSSCKKYLNQAPENALTRDDFFKTEVDANAAIMGVYDALQGCADEFITWGEFRADLVSPLTNNDITYPYFQLFEHTRPASVWSQPYNLIARANTVIERVPEIPALDNRFTEEESKAIVGEALFLRSLAYFYLVRTFKEVPLVLQPPSNDAVNYLVPKATADSILNQVEADLAIAESSVPAAYGKPAETRGRVTKGAVNALQADVFLWRAKYEAAAAAAKKVIDNAGYTLVPGVDWFNIFSQKNATESIFEIQYDYQLSETNSLRGISGNFLMNPVLFGYFESEKDQLRGLNRTFREAGSRTYWKYTGLNTDNIERPTNDPNFILYRLPDLMLLRAEALVHLRAEDKAEAASLLNQVRERVGLSPYDFLDAAAPRELFIELILKERAMELAMEGKRWFDLVRVATNEEQPDLLISRVVAGRTVAERSQIRARIIDPRGWYLPIHRDELNRNPNLVQNPYYR